MQAALSAMPTSFRGEPLPTRLRTSRWWWAIAAAAVATLVWVMIVVAESASAPRTPWDENGVLELARVFAGEDDVPLMLTRGYYPFAAFVIAPVWWFTSDAATVYGWANFLTNVVGVATILPLIGLARRMRLDLPQAITVSALALMMPAYTGLADYVLAEQFVGFFLVLSMYTAVRFWERPTFGRAGLFALSLLGGVLTHPRMIVGIGVAVIWLGGLLLKRERRLTAGVTIAVIIPAALVVNRLAKTLAEMVLVDGFSQGNALSQSLSNLSPVLVAKVAFAQSWAQLVGTLGIIAFGAVVVTAWAGREILAERQFGPGVFIFGLSLSGCLVSVLNWSNLNVHNYNGEPRLDSWLYTRYIAPFVIVVIMAGLAGLIRRLSWPMIATAIGVTVVIVAGMLLAFADSIPTWGSSYGPGNIAALRAWEDMWPDEPHDIPLTPTLTGPNRFWVVASLVVLGTQIVAVLLSRFPRVLGGTLVAGLGYYAYLSNPELERELPGRMEVAVERIEEVSGTLVSIDVDLDCGASDSSKATTANWAGYWFAPRDVDLIRPDLAERDPERAAAEPEFTALDADVYLACGGDWIRAGELGALEMPDSNNYGYSVWVPAGALQDDLVEAGVLTR